MPFHSYLLCSTFIVGLAKYLNKMDLDNVERARDVITNSVMAEITQEHPFGQTEFENAVRYQIISFSQRINVCLVVLDKLMETFNSSRASAK